MAGKGQQWDWEASLAVIYRGENKTKQKNRKWSQVLDLKTHFPWCAFFSKLHSRRFYKAHTALPADDKCLNARAYTRGDISFLNPNRMQDPCAPCEAERNRQSSSRQPPTWIPSFPKQIMTLAHNLMCWMPSPGKRRGSRTAGCQPGDSGREV